MLGLNLAAGERTERHSGSRAGPRSAPAKAAASGGPAGTLAPLPLASALFSPPASGGMWHMQQGCTEPKYKG